MTKACTKCGRVIPSGNRCPAHTTTYSYNSAHWQNVRNARLTWDNHTCQLHLPGCTGKATTVHLHPTLQGNHLLADLWNTVSACAYCHGVVDGPRSNTSTSTFTA